MQRTSPSDQQSGGRHASWEDELLLAMVFTKQEKPHGTRSGVSYTGLMALNGICFPPLLSQFILILGS